MEYTQCAAWLAHLPAHLHQMVREAVAWPLLMAESRNI